MKVKNSAGNIIAKNIQILICIFKKQQELKMPKQDTMKTEEEPTICIILLKFMMFSFCMVSTNLLSCYWHSSLCILQQFTNCLFYTFLISADTLIHYLLNFSNMKCVIVSEDYRIYN